MSARKPETPEEVWSAIEATVLAVDDEYVGTLSDEELKARLVEAGFSLDAVTKTSDAFLAELRVELGSEEDVNALLVQKGYDLAAVEKTSDAFLADLGAELDDMAEAVESAPSNVIPFERRSQAGARWAVRLVGAAAAATLAMTQAAVVALYDPWHAASARRPPEVLVDVHAAEIDRIVGAAMDAASEADWTSCRTKLAEVAPLAVRAEPDADALRATCTDAEWSLALAKIKVAADAHRWRECALHLEEAHALEGGGRTIPYALYDACRSNTPDSENSKN